MATAQISALKETHCIIKAKYCSELSPPNFPGFAKWIEGTRLVRFRPTVANIKYISAHWPDASWDDDCQHHLINFISEQKAAEDYAKLKYERLEDDGAYEYKLKPFDHQRQAFLLSRERRAFALFMEQGTGKTKVDIDRACWLYSQGLIDAYVIIAPNGVHSNWIKIELPTHLPDWVPNEMWEYNAGKTKAKEAAFEKVCAVEGKLKIFAFNIEGFTSENAKGKLQRILASNRCLVSIDESQGVKNPTANRTKYLTKECSDVAYKSIITGTNITKGVEDLYGQLTWLDPKILGLDTYTSFKGQYCTTVNFKVASGKSAEKITGYKNINSLIELMDPHSYRVLKKDCLDLPEKLYKRWNIELTKTQRKMYDQLKSKFFTHQEGDGILTAELGVVRLLRLQQIACGWFPGDDCDQMVPIKGENPRLEAVRQHCLSTDGSILVWARFKQDIELMVERLSKDHGNDNVLTYYGGTPDDQRIENVKTFQGKKAKIMICSKAAARGLTLTASENPIYHSNEFDLEVRLQSEDRCHRIGTTGNVTYTDIQADKTIDGNIIQSLINKKNIADMVNRDPESFFMVER